MSKNPYTPTRTCPHRWCKPLHLAPLPFMLAVAAFQLWSNLVFLLPIGIGLCLGWLLPRLVHYRRQPRNGPATVKDVVEDLRSSPTAFDLETEDAAYAGTGWRVLDVRKWWARVAVACDLFIALIMGWASTAIFAQPQEAAQGMAAATVDAGMFIGGFIAVVFVGFTLYAHKKATQPRKPKRAWLPASLRPTSS